MAGVKIRVPATSANLGPGFDCLGLAWQKYNTVSFEETGSSVVVTGCDAKYANENNLAIVGYYRCLEYMGEERPEGLTVHIEADVPVSRGLGSSSTLIVAGIEGANALHGSKLSRDEMLELATAMEGHPDNVAPAICGGLTAACMREDGLYCTSLHVSDDIRFTAIIPDYETLTEEARRVLPVSVPRQDAVYTVSCLAILLKALESGEERLLRSGLDDRLHQPYRKHMLKGFDDIHRKCLEAGAYGMVISGSGSTMLVVGGGEDIADRLRSVIADAEICPLIVDREGAKAV